MIRIKYLHFLVIPTFLGFFIKRQLVFRSCMAYISYDAIGYVEYNEVSCLQKSGNYF